MFPTLFRWLWYLSPYLQYVFTATLFVTRGKRSGWRFYCTVWYRLM